MCIVTICHRLGVVGNLRQIVSTEFKHESKISDQAFIDINIPPDWKNNHTNVCSVHIQKLKQNH